MMYGAIPTDWLSLLGDLERCKLHKMFLAQVNLGCKKNRSPF